MIEQVLRQLETLQRELTRINPLQTDAADQVAAMAQTLRHAATSMGVRRPSLAEALSAPRAA